ncbi:hypothetical protein LXA43DRAFT_1094817 [Ganoderma leucocontextum]|nr:hypothetical protein LXA43DRAFT_1094817 [Ganoderma leucocontextum]
MTIPTFERTTPWVAADKHPQYLATYDVDSCDVFDQPPYNTLVNMRSERERGIIARAELLDRRTCDLFECDIVPAVTGYGEYTPGPYSIALQASIGPELEDELNRWYREEHIPLLAKVPGWHRSRRCVLRGVGPSNRMAEEELKKRLSLPPSCGARMGVAREFKHAMNTPWRMRAFESAEVWNRWLFRAMRT